MATPRNQAIRNKKPDSSPPRPWGWFVSGALVGAIAVIALQFGGLLNVSPPERTGPGTGDDNPQAVTKHPPQPEFEFWTRLPKSEVIVPDVPEYASNSRTTSSQAGETYILQAGSFRTLEDADRLRAQLILLGMDVQIEKVAMDRGDIWHRVQTGPYQDRREVNAARNRLAKAGIEVMVLKRRDPAR